MIELEKISNGEENLNLPKSHQLELIIIKNFLLALFFRREEPGSEWWAQMHPGWSRGEPVALWVWVIACWMTFSKSGSIWLLTKGSGYIWNIGGRQTLLDPWPSLTMFVSTGGYPKRRDSNYRHWLPPPLRHELNQFPGIFKRITRKQTQANNLTNH